MSTKLSTFIDQFVVESRAIGSVAELFLAYQKLLQELGFDRVCYAVTSDHPTLNGGHELGVIYDNSMSDWVAHYAENHYREVDPVYKQGVASPGIQVWSDWIEQPDLSKSQRSIFLATERFRLHNGLTVSIHGVGGTKAKVSEKLAISNHTVDYHMRNILKKLDAKNTVAATAIAIKQNYISF